VLNFTAFLSSKERVRVGLRFGACSICKVSLLIILSRLLLVLLEISIIFLRLGVPIGELLIE
jgi:hypothetical protein